MDWPTAREKIVALFPDEAQAGKVFSLATQLLIDKMNSLQGLSDATIRSTLCEMAGIVDPPHKKHRSEAASRVRQTPDTMYKHNPNDKTVSQVWWEYVCEHGVLKTDAKVYTDIQMILPSSPKAYYALQWLFLCKVLAITPEMNEKMESLVHTARGSTKGYETKFHGPALALFQAASEGQNNVSFSKESRARGDRSREDIRGCLMTNAGTFPNHPSECKDQWGVRKWASNNGLEENMEGVGKVLKSILTHCRMDVDEGTWYGVFFVRFTAMWILRFRLTMREGVDHLQSLECAPQFPLTYDEDPALPLLSKFHEHKSIWPSTEYPCRKDPEEGDSKPCLLDLLQLEEGIPKGFQVMVDLVHQIVIENNLEIEGIFWHRQDLNEAENITGCVVLHASHRSVLMRHGQNCLKISDQNSSRIESRNLQQLTKVTGVRQMVNNKAYGPVRISATGLNMYGILLEGDYEEELQPKHVLSDMALCDVCQQLLDIVDAMHSKQIFHRDLKPSNILVGKNSEVCINDFDAACSRDAPDHIRCQLAGSEAYRSPNLSGATQFSTVDDILSVGLTISELIGCDWENTPAGKIKALFSLAAPESRAPHSLKDRISSALTDSN